MEHDTFIFPEVATRPARMLSRLDFPAPLGPMIAQISSGRACRIRDRMATLNPHYERAHHARDPVQNLFVLNLKGHIRIRERHRRPCSCQRWCAADVAAVVFTTLNISSVGGEASRQGSVRVIFTHCRQLQVTRRIALVSRC